LWHAGLRLRKRPCKQRAAICQKRSFPARACDGASTAFVSKQPALPLDFMTPRRRQPW
jgi:hypothetical protein